MDFKELEKEIERQLKEVKDDKNTEYEELEKELEKQLKQVKAVQTIPMDQSLLAEVEKEIQQQLNEAKMIQANIKDITKEVPELIVEVEKETQKQLNEVKNVEKETTNPVKEEPKVDSAKGRTWGETMMNDMTTEGKLPDWMKFMGKFVPQSVTAALAVLETAQAITDNKDLIVDTGKKYIEVKLKEERRVLEEQAKRQIPVPTVPQHGGAFTYEECVF